MTIVRGRVVFSRANVESSGTCGKDSNIELICQESIPNACPSTMSSGYASNRNFDEVFESTVTNLLQEKIHLNRRPSYHLSSPLQGMIPNSALTGLPSSSGKRKRSKTTTTTTTEFLHSNSSESPTPSTSFSISEILSETTKRTAEVQTGPSLILSVDTPFRSHKKKKQEIDTSCPSPKSVKIATFSKAPPTHSASGIPEISGVAGGGVGTLCRPIAIPGDKASKVDSVPSTRMVPVGGSAAFVPCVSNFSSEPLCGKKVNCGCSAHTKHHARYNPVLQSFGSTKTDPLVIDSDDEENPVIIDLDDVNSSKVQSPTVSSAAKEVL
ncbi:uncharacterized protein LOC110244852 [Exaiptasia diaphana]|uniref:Uncharacterized protein n=1 Tax=Exaiptasia diaphana TaxID=2652724 RepID=A0A913YM75_EXADI|nr:uncharacterized protein LOC110244852 [Exaiptasia diaphana]